VEQARVENRGHHAQEAGSRPGQTRQENEAHCWNHDRDRRQDQNGAEQHAGQKGEAEEMPGDPHGGGVEKGRQEKVEHQLRVDLGRGQAGQKGRSQAEPEEHERVRRIRQARQREHGPDPGQHKGDELIGAHAQPSATLA